MNAYANRAGAPAWRLSGWRCGKAFALVAAIGGYLLVEAGLWSQGSVQRLFMALAVAWIAGSTILSGRSWRELGLGFDGLRRSLWLVLFALAFALLLGRLFPPADFNPLAFFRRGWGYAIWSLQQEFILQSFLFLNLERVIGTRRAVLLAALLFALAHIPNPLLFALTLPVGLTFCWVFARHRNLWPIGIAHALLGLSIAFYTPLAVNHHMRVGAGFWRKGPPVGVHAPLLRSPSAVGAATGAGQR